MPNTAAKPLVIAEKPSMAREIAKHLPGPLSQRGGYLETADFVITSAVGHLFELAEPAAYGEQYAGFPGQMEHLPIPLPSNGFKLVPKDDKKAQIALIKKLLAGASYVVHAGDWDREGQMIVDETLLFLGNKKPVKRVVLPDLEPKTVKTAFATMKDNSLYHTWYLSALARSWFDWLLGMSMSRAMCIQGRAQGCYTTLSVGRVQTPVLAIVQEREDAIRNFVPVTHYTIRANCGGVSVKPAFWARWVPPGLDAGLGARKEVAPENMTEEDEEQEEAEALANSSAPQLPYLDTAHRLVDRMHADRVVREIKAAGQARVTKAERKEARETPPLPFEVTELSKVMERLHNMSGEDVGKACQSLYQKGYQSYPRTDSAYLPEAMRDKMPELMAAIAQADPTLAALMGPVDVTRASKVWNDGKCKVHYALVPTGTAPNLSQLSDHERWVYQAVARQLMAQFYPDCIVDKTAIEMDAGGHRLVANGRIVKSPGWRTLFGHDVVDANAKNDDDAQLPQLTVGQTIEVGEVQLKELQTTPPPRYTEASLESVMKHAYRLVSDPTMRKKLKETEGIGTAATRKPLIAMLLKRMLLLKKGKHVMPAPITGVLVRGVPQLLVRPALTAQWENALTAVNDGKLSFDQFMKKATDFVQVLITQQQTNPLPPIPAEIIAASNERKGAGASKGKSGKAGARPAFAPRPAGPPAVAIGVAPKGAGEKCVKCKKGVMTVRVVQKEGPNRGKQFLGCSNPSCDKRIWS